MEMYMVGGAVRDEILGVHSADIDFTVVFDENEKDFLARRAGFVTQFQLMADNLRGRTGDYGRLRLYCLWRLSETRYVSLVATARPYHRAPPAFFIYV